MASSASITAERLRELYSYNPETGQFIHMRGTGRGRIGAVAGTARANGYLTINVDGVRCYAHRAAWLYMTGEWPQSLIDHIDRNRLNNRWINLRSATAAQNQMNKSSRRNSYSRFVGVTFCKKRKKWKAQIGIDRKMFNLGYFLSEQDAAKAYAAVKPKFHQQAKAIAAG